MKIKLPLALCVLFLGTLITYRAFVIPMTHDEASSWLNYHNTPIWSCFSDPKCWGTANNHWLNTLLFQWCESLFGNDPWALRIPNIVSGWGYLICASLLCSRYIKTFVLQLLGFLLLSGHVYLLDFFSLARGYGIMTCGVIWGMYSLIRYTEQWSVRWLLICIGSVFLAILGNFTAILAYLSVGLVWLVYVVASRKTILLLRHGIYWAISAIILFLLLRLPVSILSSSGEFTQGANNVYETGVNLMQVILYGHTYFEVLTPPVLLVFFLLLILVFLVQVSLRKPSDSSPFVLVTTLLFANILMIVLQQFLTGSHTPVSRKSIYLIPLLFSAVSLGFACTGHRRLRLVGAGVIIILLIMHSSRVLEFRHVREWYYDAYYPELLSVILPEGAQSDSVHLATSWIFYPALNFYKETVPLPFSDLPYQRPLVVDSTKQYYYVEQPDSNGMYQHGFHYAKSIGPFFLFKNSRQAVFPEE